MKAIDAFLGRHRVDVGRSVGLLLMAGAVDAAYEMLGRLFIGQEHIDLSALLWVLIGMALWRHASWSRLLLLVACWGVVLGFAVLLVVIPFTGTSHLTLTLGSTAIKNPSLAQAYALAVCLAPGAWFTLAVLHSETAKKEFKKTSQPPEPTPGR